MLDIPVRVKDALREGRLLKNYKINVLNDNMSTDFTIDSNNLVAESVKFDERMCSGDTLKFGLCEGASLEFQYFDKDDILGRQIQVFLDVQYEDANGDLQWYSDLPMGYFTVAKCPQQYSTGIYKVTAYNKLMSEYLDTNVKDKIVEIAQTGAAGAASTTNIGLVLDELLGDYSIKRKEFKPSGSWSYVNNGTSTGTYREATLSNGSYVLGTLRVHILYMQLRFTPTDYSLNNVYRGAIDCSRVYAKALSYVPNTFKNQVMTDTSQTYYATFMNFFNWGTDEQGTTIATNGVRNSVLLNGGSGQYYSELEVNANQHRYDDVLTTDWLINANSYGFNIIIPCYYVWSTESSHTWTDEEVATAKSRIDDIVKDQELAWYEESAQGTFEKTQLTYAEALLLPDVTLRDLQSSVYETMCQFGQLSRTTDLFAGVELNQSALYPSDTLYPADTLYPGGTRERTVKSGYSKLWSESGNVQSWRFLTIVWKGLDENNVAQEYTSSYTVSGYGTQDYIMDDNWLLKNLTWTQADINSLAASMIAKMTGIKWFPFELWGAGLPYVETGDQIEIVDSDNVTHTSYVLERQLNGIQNLQDTYINGVLDIF